MQWFSGLAGQLPDHRSGELGPRRDNLYILGYCAAPTLRCKFSPYHSTGALPQPAENRTLTSDKTFLHDSDQYTMKQLPCQTLGSVQRILSAMLRPNCCASFSIRPPEHSG
jgi:hypothetical protein